MIKKMRCKELLFGISLLLAVPTMVVEASDITVRPFLIDRTVEARQFLEEDVTLVNNTTRRLNVYATVNEITVDSQGEIKSFESPIMSDRTNTPTSWVEIRRGRIEIEPGETATVPLGFRIHPNAEPGEYHMFIGFGVASKRFQAEQAAMAGNVDGIIVKLTIEDDSVEFLRISGFLIDRFVTGGDDNVVSIELENLGDVEAVPEGEVIFFTSTGQELNAIPLNTDKIRIPPGDTVTITSEIPFTNKLGRFKANLSLQYGQNQRATLYDTTQFFMMPFHIVTLMFVTAVLLSTLIFFLLHRALVYREELADSHELPFVVRDGHDSEPKDHDIDLSQNN
jgi:hypothetical protein